LRRKQANVDSQRGFRLGSEMSNLDSASASLGQDSGGPSNHHFVCYIARMAKGLDAREEQIRGDKLYTRFEKQEAARQKLFG
jgi:hypothetical protein